MDKAIGAGRRRNERLRRRTPPNAPRSLLWSPALVGVAAAFAVFAAGGCAQPEDEQPIPIENSLEVTASAYNSTPAQTNDNPTLSAWGDTLEPGMRVIAVSRDLIPLGLGHGAVVRIEGLEGDYVVRDKMAKRWQNKIDIYMGNDVAAAREWGKRELTIYWAAE